MIPIRSLGQISLETSFYVKTKRTLVRDLIHPLGRFAGTSVGSEVSMHRWCFPTFELHEVLEPERSLFGNDRSLQISEISSNFISEKLL